MPLNTQSTAEFLFLLIVIWMLAGPVSGAFLAIQGWLTTGFVKGTHTYESTKNLANQLLTSAERIRTLEMRLAEQEIEVTRLKQEVRDTNKLRGLLGLKAKMPRSIIAADVIARNPDNWYQQLIVGKGTADKVTVGSAVITNEGVVGQVVKADEHTAVVRMLTDPEQKLGAVIKKLGSAGILSGNFQKPAHLDFIPVGANVDIGDQVICLGGKGGPFPENHPVGTVAAVRRDSNATTLAIEVKLSENCYDLSQVLILPPQVDR